MSNMDEREAGLNNLAELLSMKDPSKYTTVETALARFLGHYDNGKDDNETEYAVAREEWPTVPVYRKRTLEQAQAFADFPPLGEKKHGWIVIARPKPTNPEWKRI